MKDEIRSKEESGVDPIEVFLIIRDVAVLVSLSWVSLFTNAFLFRLVFHRHLHAGFFIGYFALLFVLMIAGNFASACLARKNRWVHLLCVTIGVWAVDLLGYFTISGLDSNFLYYIAIRLYLIVIPMVLGGALSYFFKK